MLLVPQVTMLHTYDSSPLDIFRTLDDSQCTLSTEQGVVETDFVVDVPSVHSPLITEVSKFSSANILHNINPNWSIDISDLFNSSTVPSNSAELPVLVKTSPKSTSYFLANINDLLEMLFVLFGPLLLAWAVTKVRTQSVHVIDIRC